MLSVSTTEAISIIDSITLKNSPPAVPLGQPLPSPPIASVWSQDNTALFVAFADSIRQYSPSGLPTNEVYLSPGVITSLIAKDKGKALIFAASNQVHVLEYGSGEGKITQTFTSHNSAVNALSLSNDGALLASMSSSSAHIHNLSLGSHTVLRGLPPLSSGQITTCAFHPHSRTRLLIGMGKQVIVYDTTRPSGPIKVIPMSDASSGDIVALACSPFSKSLVAIATSGGNVGLVDLDKEKSLFRTLNIKMPLTSVSFSPEGAALYFGSENGKLLNVDLRVLDKPPKCIVIGEGGCRIVCMSFHKKLKAGLESKTKLAASTSSKPTDTTTTNLTQRPSALKSAAAAPSPARRRPTTKAGLPSGSPARIVRKGSTTATNMTSTQGAASAKTDTLVSKPVKNKVFSPVRDPLGNSVSAEDISVQMETLGSLRKKNAHNENGYLYGKERRPSSQLSASRVTTTTSRTSSASGLDIPETHRSKTRAGSIIYKAESAVSARSADLRSRPISRAESSISQGESPDLPTPHSISAFSKQASRTPSPDLPSTRQEPVTPVPVAKKRAGLGVLGLGTPEVERWIEAGKGREQDKGDGRRVGFKEIAEDEDEKGRSGGENAGVASDETQRNLQMQISPRRVPSWPQHHNAVFPSPLRPSLAQSPSSPSAAAAAHTLLRTIMADVMYDYQCETKAEMMGIHLDLVRMGRGLRKELREVGGSEAREIQMLREENRMLRAENERLKRGY